MSDEAAETWKTEIWILNEYRSSKNELHFHGYNAKLVPLPEWKNSMLVVTGLKTD